MTGSGKAEQKLRQTLIQCCANVCDVGAALDKVGRAFVQIIGAESVLRFLYLIGVIANNGDCSFIGRLETPATNHCL